MVTTTESEQFNVINPVEAPHYPWEMDRNPQMAQWASISNLRSESLTLCGVEEIGLQSL